MTSFVIISGETLLASGRVSEAVNDQLRAWEVSFVRYDGDVYPVKKVTIAEGVIIIFSTPKAPGITLNLEEKDGPEDC